MMAVEDIKLFWSST